MEDIKDLGFRVILILFVALLVWPVWNLVMPDVFALPKITYIQSMWMTILVNLFALFRD